MYSLTDLTYRYKSNNFTVRLIYSRDISPNSTLLSSAKLSTAYCIGK